MPDCRIPVEESKLDQLFELLEQMQSQCSPVAGWSELRLRAWRLGLTPLSERIDGYRALVGRLAQQLSKKIEVQFHGMNLEIRPDLADALNTGLLHALRNAVDHGIDQQGMIQVRAEIQGATLRLQVIDNGKGPDFGRIRAKAIKQGLLRASDAPSASEEQLLEFLFEPAFSTRDQATSISGRGVGLDAVRAALEAVGGKATAVRGTDEKGFILEMSAPIFALICCAKSVKKGDRWFWERAEDGEFCYFRPLPAIWAQANSWIREWQTQHGIEELLYATSPEEASGQPFSILN